MARPKENSYSREYAESLDRQNGFRNFRSEFVIPTKADLKRKTLAKPLSMEGEEDKESCIYLSGNSLGLQPRRTAERISSHLSAWASKGVTGHFRAHDDSNLPPFVNLDDVAAEKMAALVGAAQDEVAVMETLTANLHILMASFYRPTKERYKIIIEGGAFPSDHFAVESHIRHHDLDIRDAMVLIEPIDGESPNISTSHVFSIIDKHASSAALILLPGIQYYTGQCFDIKRITARAHSHGIISGWDLAHAVGNVDMELHNWDVDFAVWCNYKYVNAGPGAIAALFVHEKHSSVDTGALGDNREGFRPRLSGWWGSDKATRFEMDNRFVPITGAAGFQLGNPSVLAITALLASLEIFSFTSMASIRAQSMALTGYLEDLLLATSQEEPYKIITPSSRFERGAQLSLLLKPGLLVGVMKYLEDSGVVVDERKPDVIRVAPVPLYNSFCDVWDFVHIFKEACQATQKGHLGHDAEATMIQGKRKKGWSQIM